MTIRPLTIKIIGLLFSVILCSCIDSRPQERLPKLTSTWITSSTKTSKPSKTNILGPTTLVPTASQATMPAWSTTPTPSPTNTPTTSLTPTAFPDGYILFEDDFEQGLSKWVFLPNKANTQNDESGNHFLCIVDRSERIFPIQLGDESWRNYQLSFDIKETDLDVFVSDIGIKVRRNEQLYYFFHIDIFILGDSVWEFSTEESLIWFWKEQNIGQLTTRSKVYIPKISEDKWYEVVIGVNEGHISLYWNGELLIDFRDEEYIPQGSIEFLLIPGVCLDNIQVTNLGNAE